MKGERFAPDQEHAIDRRFLEAVDEFERCTNEDEGRALRAAHLRRSDAEDSAATTGTERKRLHAVRAAEFTAYRSWLAQHRAASARRGEHAAV